MAKKKSGVAANGSKRRRKRRTPEEIIADLQEEIRRVRNRQVARELKSSPSMKAAMTALKWLDKALDAAAEDGDTSLRHALADGRKPLASFLEEKGLKVPKANLPKGRRPKGS